MCNCGGGFWGMCPHGIPRGGEARCKACDAWLDELKERFLGARKQTSEEALFSREWAL